MRNTIGIRTMGALACVLCLLLFFAGCGKEEPQKAAGTAYEIVDVQGTKITFEKKPERIMTYALALDEVVLGLVPPEKMISVDKALADERQSNIPELAARVGNPIPRFPSVEKIISMKPDVLFVQTWLSQENIESLRAVGIPVVVCNAVSSYEDAQKNVALIADALGEHEKGEQLLQLMDEKMAEIDGKIAALPEEDKNKSVALISIMPSYGGAGCSFDFMCERAGAVNAKAAAGNKSGQAMTKEQLVAAHPDYLFLPSYGDESSREEQYGQEYIGDPSLATMPAIIERNICHPRARFVYNGSQNIVFGVQEVAQILYGEDFQQELHSHLSVADS